LICFVVRTYANLYSSLTNKTQAYVTRGVV